jgi:hypothetical protein
MSPLFPQGAESLVPDARAGLSPADALERKLVRALAGAPVRSSHLRSAAGRGREGAGD